MGDVTPPELNWEKARLIPTAGIRGQDEQEKRATSAFLAVMHAVPDFAHTLLKPIGAPKGQVSTFTEVRLEDGAGQVHIPDGAIVVTRGRTRWSCLVEVKTGRSALDAEQVTRYLESARDHGFDGLLTISNQIRTSADDLPYVIDKRKVGRLGINHVSWWRIQTEAIRLHRFRGVDDPDQALILNELIRYLDDPKSGASGFEDMGKEWSEVRDAAKNETLRTGDPGTALIAHRWDQFVEYLAMRLSQELGVDVHQPKARKANSSERSSRLVKSLAADGTLNARLNIPDAIGPIDIEANLRTGRVTTSVELPAPDDGRRPKTQVNWLLRQLKDAPPGLRVEVKFVKTKRTMSELLERCDDRPECLLLEDDLKREPRSFVLAWPRKMGRKRGRVDGSFVTETKRQVIEFYGELVQNLVPPPTRPPRLPDLPAEADHGGDGAVREVPRTTSDSATPAARELLADP